jgi:hypothetical protein
MASMQVLMYCGIVLAGSSTALRAQCADGTPPPCRASSMLVPALLNRVAFARGRAGCTRITVAPESAAVWATPRECTVFRLQSQIRGSAVIDSLASAIRLLGYQARSMTYEDIDSVGGLVYLRAGKRVVTSVTPTDTVYAESPLVLMVAVVNSRPVYLGIVADHPRTRRDASASVGRVLRSSMRLLAGSLAYGGL